MKHDLDLNLPVFDLVNKPLPLPPPLTLEQWADWLEQARTLQCPKAFEEWLKDPKSLPHGEPFEM